MTTPNTPLSIQAQIALTERTITASDEHLHALRTALAASARRTFMPRRQWWLAGAAVLLVAGVALYPKRRAVLRYVRAAFAHPLCRSLTPHVPGLRGAMSWVSLMSRWQSRKPVGAALLTLISASLPWLLRRVQDALPNRQPPSP